MLLPIKEATDINSIKLLRFLMVRAVFTTATKTMVRAVFKNGN